MEALEAVCPVHGVAIGRRNDRNTWRIDYKSEATDQQKAAAQEVLLAFDIDAPTAGMIDAERDRRLLHIAFGGKLYDFCDAAQSDKNIAGAATLALAAIIAGAQPGNLQWAGTGADFCWIAHDNSMVPMDAQTTLAFGQHAAVWKAQHVFTARALKDMRPIPNDYDSDARWPS
jgi:hypothetical protein